MERALSKGKRFVPLYIRRLLALFIFGTIHAFLIWDGDILTEYALLGLVLLLFRKAKPKTLLIWAVSLYLLFSLPFILASFHQANGQEWAQAAIQQAKQALHAYGNGSLKDIAEQRIHDRLVYMSMNGMLTYNPLNFFLPPSHISVCFCWAPRRKIKIAASAGKAPQSVKKSMAVGAGHWHQRSYIVQCDRNRSIFAGWSTFSYVFLRHNDCVSLS